MAKIVSEKMIRRHPHVFSGVTYKTREDQHDAWEKIKAKEKAGKEWHEQYLREAFTESSKLIEQAKECKGF